MKNMFRVLLAGLILLFKINVVTAQMVIDNTLTPQQLVQDVLVGQGVQVSNITFTGDPVQIGYFDASNANFSITSGIVMSTGEVTDVPNTGGTFATTPLLNPGDPDLDIVEGAGTNDAVILQFDFVPTGDSISFDYIFGSEEYPDQVGLGFNDAFIFTISGPGFAGPFTNGAENIALIPGTTTAVSIETLNDVINSQFYVDNDFGTDPNGIVFDGYTVTLTAGAQVQCGETYTLKLALADGGDFGYDSGVFLEANSFNSNAVEVNISTASGSPEEGGGWIVENCSPAEITFSRPPAAIANEDTVPVYITGNAINGVDYTGIPDTVFFGIGDTTVTFSIEALDDNLTEPNDSIILTVYSINLCGDSIESTGVIQILDFGSYEYEIVASENQTVECAGDSVLLTAEGFLGNPEYTFNWSNGEVGDSIWVTPQSDSTIYVSSEDECGTFSNLDSVLIEYNVNPLPEVTINGPITFDCIGQSVLLTAVGSQGNSPYVYLWNTGSGSASINPTLNSDTAFSVIATDQCNVQTESDTIYITMNPVNLPTVSTSNDVLLDCPGETATLTAIPSPGGPYTYSWSGTNETTSTITVQPSQTTEYVVTVTDDCYQVAVTDTVTVTVDPYESLSVTVDDVSVPCPEDEVILTANVDGGNPPFSYSWSNGSQDQSITENPAVTTTYSVTVTDQCNLDAQADATVEVPVYDPLAVSVLSSDLITSDTVTICELWSDTAWAEVTGGLAPYTYTWFGTLIESADVSNDSALMTVPYELPPDSSVFETYSLTVMDECEEEVMVEFPVNVISCDIFQPGSFNPESDFTGTTDFCGNVLQNNAFNLPCLNLYPGNTVTIWDRWGRKCYQTEDYHLSPWDGGKQSSGTYYYVCEFSTEKEPIKGFFQLVR